jgi:hypothetical protein
MLDCCSYAYSQTWWTSVAWCVHAAAVWAVMRMMALPVSLPWGELMAYTGYMFVPACLILLVGMAGGACVRVCVRGWGEHTP